MHIVNTVLKYWDVIKIYSKWKVQPGMHRHWGKLCIHNIQIHRATEFCRIPSTSIPEKIQQTSIIWFQIMNKTE